MSGVTLDIRLSIINQLQVITIMSQSINFYIPLSVRLSTLVDSLNKPSLAQLASDVMVNYREAYDNCIGHCKFSIGNEDFELPTDFMPLFASGLLSKTF